MLEDMRPPVREIPCKIRTILESLDAADHKILADALANDSWAHNALSTALKKRGILVGHETIRKHRRRECSC